jgi:hypothetical protein
MLVVPAGSVLAYSDNTRSQEELKQQGGQPAHYFQLAEMSSIRVLATSSLSPCYAGRQGVCSIIIIMQDAGASL